MRARWCGPVLALVLALAGCGGGGDDPEPVPSPLADCSDLVTTEPRTPAEPLPAITLPCFTGGEPVALDQLRGPAVVNLWASWCAPCREELPAMQRFADQAGDQVRVVGVVTDDRPSAAAALAEDLGVSFPALDDQKRAVLAGVGGLSLPVTLFVDASGSLSYTHPAPLDEAELARLVQEKLGVTLG